jgi:hypothetical protein
LVDCGVPASRTHRLAVPDWGNGCHLEALALAARRGELDREFVLLPSGSWRREGRRIVGAIPARTGSRG